MTSPLNPRRPRLSAGALVLLAAIVLSPLTLAMRHLGRSEAERALSSVPMPLTRPEHVQEGTPSGDAATRPVRHPVRHPVRELGELPRPLLGFALNAHHISDLPAYIRGVDEIAQMNANTLIVVTPAYQRKVDSTSIRYVRTRCPRTEQLEAILTRAKMHGLYTILMPIVLIEDPGPDDWRGVIAPRNWDDWWSSYESFIGRFTDLAVRAEVDVLSIGSELNTTEDQIDRWQGIVDRVRQRYDGLLTYSSNWDRYDKVTLWPLVDIMSVSSYFELERDRPGAPEADLVRAWKPVQRALLDTARRWNRPLLMSEVGYPSLPWANAHPWNYVAENGMAADHEAQARCWRAFFAAWRDVLADPEAGVLGVCGYRWDPYHQGGEQDTGYGVVGKPALGIIESGFRELRRGG